MLLQQILALSSTFCFSIFTMINLPASSYGLDPESVWKFYDQSQKAFALLSKFAPDSLNTASDRFRLLTPASGTPTWKWDEHNLSLDYKKAQKEMDYVLSRILDEAIGGVRPDIAPGIENRDNAAKATIELESRGLLVTVTEVGSFAIACLDKKVDTIVEGMTRRPFHFYEGLGSMVTGNGIMQRDDLFAGSPDTATAFVHEAHILGKPHLLYGIPPVVRAQYFDFATTVLVESIPQIVPALEKA